MASYLLSVHTTAAAPTDLTEEEMRRGFEPVMALEAKMRAAGALRLSGRLTDAAEAHVVRPGKRRVHAIDGPYIETKEWLGGFYIIDAPDDPAAFEWAGKVATAIKSPIEVRRFAGLMAG